MKRVYSSCKMKLNPYLYNLHVQESDLWCWHERKQQHADRWMWPWGWLCHLIWFGFFGKTFTLMCDLYLSLSGNAALCCQVNEKQGIQITADNSNAAFTNFGSCKCIYFVYFHCYHRLCKFNSSTDLYNFQWLMM